MVPTVHASQPQLAVSRVHVLFRRTQSYKGDTSVEKGIRYRDKKNNTDVVQLIFNVQH